jgi:hypothetical protein
MQGDLHSVIIMYKASFMQLSLNMYTAYIINPRSFSMHILWLHIYTAWLFLCFLPEPFCPHCHPHSYPFVLPFTYLAPSSCDRNCPPSYQVAYRLTPFAPPFTQSTHPFRIPRAPTAQRLTTTTLGPLRFHYAEHLRWSY